MVSTLATFWIDGILEQFLNALFPTEVKASKVPTSAISLQFSKALLPMVCTLFTFSNLGIPAQFKNALSPIVTKLFKLPNSVREVQSVKAFAPIDCTLDKLPTVPISDKAPQ